MAYVPELDGLIDIADYGLIDNASAKNNLFYILLSVVRHPKACKATK